MLYLYLSENLPNYEHIVVTDNQQLDKELRALNIATVEKNSKQYFKIYQKLKCGLPIRDCHHR